MASAKISAMTPMTMTGKNFSGSSDRIWAATASASENRKAAGGQKVAAQQTPTEELQIRLFAAPSLNSENGPASRKSS